MFADRTEAGRRLATHLQEAGVAVDLVLAIPRGGLPVGRVVADAFGVPLDVVVASKLGAPHNQELALGAVAGDGSRWLNEDLIDRLGIDQSYIESQSEVEAAAAREKVESYRKGEPVPDVGGKQVIVVDDGIATGATAMAVLRQVTGAGADHVVFAVPVGPREAFGQLRDEADAVVILETPAYFGAVGGHYRDFGQVSDAEAIEYLRERS